MTTFITIHTRYTDTQIGLFSNTLLLDWVSDDNKKISKSFFILLTALLEKHKLTLHDLDYIAAHQGPAPFTSLRVALACVNGLAFATHIPLIGINGLGAFISEYNQVNRLPTIALLNAFAHDIYYAFYIPQNGIVAMNSGPAKDVMQQLSQLTYTTKKIHFIGNAVQLYTGLINQYFSSRAIIPQEIPAMASLDAIGIQAYKKAQDTTQFESQLMPIYLKSSSSMLGDNSPCPRPNL